MRGLLSAHLLLLFSLISTALSETPPSKNAVRLSNVQTLTLRADQQTAHRRVSPLPQLKCVGPEQVCKLYQIDTMRCTNQGYDYDEEDIQWSCTANLPSEFKLGSTDVICEGYRNADDKWILKGSCGVEYRLLLTEKGEERYGRWRQSTKSSKDGDNSENNTLSNIILVIIFIVILFVIVVAITGGPGRNANQGRQPRSNNRGGGGGGDDDDDPPPPYDYQPRSRHKKSDSGPGFWTGAAAGGAAGGAAGYAMGRRHNQQQYDRQTRAGPSYTRRDDYDPGPAPGPSQSFSPVRSNTGFGSTRRR